MTLDSYTFWIFVAGLLAGIGLMLLGLAAADQVFIVRYLHQRRHAGPRPNGSSPPSSGLL